MTAYYRAKLTLEEVDERAVDQGNGWRTDRDRTISSFILTDPTTDGVIEQLFDHVDTLRRTGVRAGDTKDDNGEARLRVKAEALREAAGAAPFAIGEHHLRDWLRDEAHRLEALADGGVIKP